MSTDPNLPAPAATSSEAATLALIDAIRELDKRQQEQHRLMVRIETRLVRLINHLGAQHDINTKKGPTA